MRAEQRDRLVLALALLLGFVCLCVVVAVICLIGPEPRPGTPEHEFNECVETYQIHEGRIPEVCRPLMERKEGGEDG